MNLLKNSVQLIGNLGKDVSLVTFDSGRTLANFSIAINDGYKDAEGNLQTKTYWHNVKAWGKLGENIAKSLQKGSQVMIKGKLVTNSYTDKDGVNRYSTEVVAQDFMTINK